VAEFLEQVYLPFYRGKWKESTAGTSENRLRHHIGKELGTPLGRSHTSTTPAVPGAEGGIRPVIQRCGSSPVGPLFNVPDGRVGKGNRSKPDHGALYTKDSETQREPIDVCSIS